MPSHSSAGASVTMPPLGFRLPQNVFPLIDCRGVHGVSASNVSEGAGAVFTDYNVPTDHVLDGKHALTGLHESALDQIDQGNGAAHRRCRWGGRLRQLGTVLASRFSSHVGRGGGRLTFVLGLGGGSCPCCEQASEQLSENALVLLGSPSSRLCR